MNASSPDYVLIARELGGIATAEEKARLEAWIAAAPEHRRIWMVLREAWMLSDGTAHRSAYDADVDWPKVLARIDGLRASPVTAMPVGTRARPSSSRRAGMGRAALRAAALAGILLAPWVAWKVTRTRAHPVAMVEVTTPRGGTRETVLPDGSRARLGAESSIRYARTFDGPVRAIELRGMAYFEVVHKAEKPFLVRVRNGVTVRDVGTRFVINAYPELPRVEVAVADGSIALSSGRTAYGEVGVSAGQVGRVAEDGALTVTKDESPDAHFAWMRGLLVLHDRPLAEALVELGRWYDVHLEVHDARLAAQRISTIAGDVPLDDVLAKMTLALGARREQRGDTTVILR